MENEGEKREKLNKLETKLYSRNGPNIIDKGRSALNESIANTSNRWQNFKNNDFDEMASKVSNATVSKKSLINKIFIGSLVFFVLAVCATAFVFFGGMNFVSSKNVDIEISGPISVPASQEVSFDINIINNNNVDLNGASLLLEYSEGIRSQNDLSKDIGRERFALDTIKSGESYKQNVKLFFFGEKESRKTIKISLEYRVENSSALFYKEKLHEVSISSAPIILTPTYPKEVNSNQDITFNLEVASNAKDTLEDFLVNVDYPFGFVFKGSSPEPAYGQNIWKFQNLGVGEKRKIAISGTVIGQDNEERVFRITAGTASDSDDRQIAVPLSQLTESITVKKPFIGLSVLLSGKNSDVSGQGGIPVSSNILVSNNLPSRLFNATVSVELKGGAFNKLAVSPGGGGFFQSSNNTILWDKRSTPELADMGPGTNQNLNFSVTPFLYSEVSSNSKPEIEMVVTVKGERILDSGSVEYVSAVETRKIILATDVNLSSRVARSVGNIENSGPIPPKVDTPTTYTAIWSISNSFNQISNVEVRATLPPYIKWTGLKSPSGEIINFNQVTNEIVWSVGSILPNTGFSSPRREVMFQLEFLPSTSQIGSSPIILSEAKITGIDKVTGSKIDSMVASLTTNFSTDPTFKQRDDKVVQ